MSEVNLLSESERPSRRYSGDLLGYVSADHKVVEKSIDIDDAINAKPTDIDPICQYLTGLFATTSPGVHENIKYVYNITKMEQYGVDSMIHLVSGTMFETVWEEMGRPLNGEVIVRSDDGSNLIMHYVRFVTTHNRCHLLSATLDDRYLTTVKNIIFDRNQSLENWPDWREFSLDQFQHLVALLNNYLLVGSSEQ